MNARSKTGNSSDSSSDSSSVESSGDWAPLLEKTFDIDVEDDSYLLNRIDGEVPSYIRGRYYLNGPSRFRHGDRRYRHWLDGDGMVSHLRFAADGVRLTHRFVRSAKWVAEQEAGKALYRTFGTAWPGDQLKRGIGLESPANVSAFLWRDTLLAFGEQGLPYELDPDTLETKGEYTFGGKLNAISPLSAHPCIDSQSGEMFNFGISFSPRQPSLSLYRFANDDSLIYRRRLAIDFPCSVHDFILAPRHVIFYLSPHVLDVGTMLKEGGSVMDGLSWQPELGSRLLIVDRESGEAVAKIAIGERYCLHLINAFEGAGQSDGKLVLDVVEIDRPVYDQYQVIPDLFVDAPTTRPSRLVLDVEAETLLERQELGYTACQDFPAIDPRYVGSDYRDFWVLGISHTGRPGRKFFDQVVHLDWANRQATGRATDIYQAPEHCYFGGEPVFLGDPQDPSRGTVICQQFDARQGKGAFLLFDAFDIAAGPTATLHLETPLPLCFHACFYSDPPGLSEDEEHHG